MSEALTTAEAVTLQTYESIIRKGLSSFVEVGSALTQIRDGRLYRETHSDFESDCREKWQLSKTHINRLVSAAEAVEAVTPTGVIPSNERQARPLTLLESPEEQAEAWQEAVETAPEGRITAEHVEQVVRRRLEDDNERDPEAVESHGIVTDLSTLVSAGAKFGAIYADPPWAYDNKGTRSAVDGVYKSTMTLDEICAEPVRELAADKCHLHLWTTNAFLFDARRVLEAWGFEYKSCFVWVKTQMGIGNYWRVSHEFMLLGVRGGMTFQDRGQKSWLEIPRTTHSRKPEEIRGIIEKVSPGPYLELYGRRPPQGDWTVYGNEIESEAVA